MALSPQYSWPEPDNASLVKNGAQDIRALGDAIDTSVWNIGYGQAGKNKIINGNFGIWQRGTSLASAGYLADRFQSVVTTTTITQSQQTFTPGTAPVAGYEAQYFYRAVTTSGSTAGSRALVQQPIENVRTFAGETVTVSFWAKAGSGTPKIGVELAQVFGSGGSSAVTAIGATAKTISTSWTRYTVTASVPSISGKTIGTSSFLGLIFWIDAGSDFATRASSIGNQSGTFDIWGVQIEAGSVATAFQTATGTLQGELAACQRYYFRTGGDLAYQYLNLGFANSTTQAWVPFESPSTLRVPPISLEYSTLAMYNGGSVIAITAATINAASKDVSNIQFTVASGLTNGAGYYVITDNSTSGFLALNAEL
jgi:hypothetical protein